MGGNLPNAAPVSFDDHFYETVHGTTISQQLYPHHHYKDDSVHGSTYSNPRMVARIIVGLFTESRARIIPYTARRL